MDRISKYVTNLEKVYKSEDKYNLPDSLSILYENALKGAEDKKEVHDAFKSLLKMIGVYEENINRDVLLLITEYFKLPKVIEHEGKIVKAFTISYTPSFRLDIEGDDMYIDLNKLDTETKNLVQQTAQEVVNSSKVYLQVKNGQYSVEENVIPNAFFDTVYLVSTGVVFDDMTEEREKGVTMLDYLFRLYPVFKEDVVLEPYDKGYALVRDRI